jgi:hypothetical protein
MGAMTSPGRAHLLALDAPNLLVTAYPLVMVPTFAVPLALMLHGLVLWRLRRGAAATGRLARPDASRFINGTGELLDPAYLRHSLTGRDLAVEQDSQSLSRANRGTDIDGWRPSLRANTAGPVLLAHVIATSDMVSVSQFP